MTDKDNRIDEILKKMIQGIFGLSDEETANLEVRRAGDPMPLGMNMPMQQEANPFEDKPPLIEIHEHEDHYTVLIEISGYSEEQLFINIRKEESGLNLIFGIQDANGRMHLRRVQLPDDATEQFEREVRGPVVELTVKRTK